MTRIKSLVLRRGTFTALIAATLLASGSAMAGEIKLAHFMSPKHPMDRFIMRPWSKQVAELSKGSLTVRIYPGGALGKGPVAQYKRAVDGVADITFGLPGFTSSLFPRTGMIELPGMAEDSVAGANKLWDAFPLLAPEWKNVKVLALWCNERQVIMTKNKPVRSIADLKGLKIRTPSRTQADTIRALGAVPVPMPINRVYNALNTGVIDGVLTGPSTIRSFKFDEVAKYYTTGLPWGRSPFFLVMNKKAWAAQTAEHKALIERTTGRALSVKAAKFYGKAGKAGLDKVRKSAKHEVIELSAAEQAKGAKLLFGLRAKSIETLEKKGIPARKIAAAMGIKG